MARQLKQSGHRFGYETEVIPYLKPAKTAKYNPDFILKKKDGSLMYIEAKGRFLIVDRQKHLLIRDQHPDKDIRILFQNANGKIGKTSKTTYAMWCEKKGIKYADKSRIPKEWLDECL